MKSKVINKNLFQLTLTSLLLTTYVSCGGYSSGSSNYNPPVPQEEQSQEGTFRTVANAVNANVTSSSGATQIKIQGDQFEAQVFGSGPAGASHAQFINSGTRCPTRADDTNQDGVIDSVEGAAVYGSPTLPLDSELTTNGGEFPSTPTYAYSQSASFSAMLGNLNIPALNVEGKTITIQGVPESTNLPTTAQGSKTDFPLACGVLQKVNAVE